MNKIPAVFAICLLVCSVMPGMAAGTITTGSLVREMIDMRNLTDFPDPAYKTVQFSSYDHRSNHPGGPEWFANSDGFGSEPIPNFEAVLKQPGDDGIGEYLMCDIQQPGAIVRVWTARIEGTIRLYLDGASEPVFDGSANDFLMFTYKPFLKDTRISEKDLEGAFHQRNAGYFPIPFAKSCRIEWIGDIKKIHFYQVQIRLYDQNARIETFQPGDLKTYRKDIEEVAEILKSPETRWEYASSEELLPIAVTVPPGETQTALELEGPKAVECLSLRVSAKDLQRALRQTILHIRCDGYPWGQVQAPLGDFFGAAPGINPYDSVPFTVQSNGTMTCRYVMPFKESMQISIKNMGEQDVTVTGSALPMAYQWNDDSSMHFRARWRVDHDLTAAGDSVMDMPYLIANGRGVYVGTATMLLNPSDGPHPGGCWWGEGDEKIFVDDDVQPSTFGTGSEDYFNYAWSAPDIFIYPYCGQPRNDGPANRGFVTNNRWHIIDPLPFKERISFYMELFSHHLTPEMSYARIGYHYGIPGLMDDHLPITGEDVRHLELPEAWQPAARGGASNSVFYQTETLLLDRKNTFTVSDNLYSGGEMMVWKPKERGEELEIIFPILEDGNYDIHIVAALQPTSGPLTLMIDGTKAGYGGEESTINLYVPYRTLLRKFSPQAREFTRGEHRLTLCHDLPKDERGNTEYGIDFLWIQKRK